MNPHYPTITQPQSSAPGVKLPLYWSIFLLKYLHPTSIHLCENSPGQRERSLPDQFFQLADQYQSINRCHPFRITRLQFVQKNLHIRVGLVVEECHLRKGSLGGNLMAHLLRSILLLRRTLHRPVTTVAAFVAHIQCMALRSEEHTSELQSRGHLVCRLLL